MKMGQKKLTVSRPRLRVRAVNGMPLASRAPPHIHAAQQPAVADVLPGTHDGRGWDLRFPGKDGFADMPH